jgi:PAS domain S-box-containing protein
MREQELISYSDLSNIIENLQCIVFKVKKREDGTFIYTFAEGKVAEVFRKTTKEVYGKTPAETSCEQRSQFLLPMYERAYKGEVVSYEEEYAPGVFLLTTLSPIIENGLVSEVVGSAIDITARRKMERELYESNQRISNIIESMSDGFFTINCKGFVTYINSQAAKVLQKKPEKIIGKYFEKVLPELYEGYHHYYEHAIQKQAPVKYEIYYNRRWFEVRIYPSVEGFTIYFSDITENKRSEEILRKSDKLTAVGQLAAGVAHEIRNPLTALKGFVHLLNGVQGVNPHYTDIMHSELERIEFIVSEFLILAKPQVVHFQKSHPIKLIKNTIEIIKTQAILNNVGIITNFEENIPEIYCEENQLKQVFINILKNSIEAMVEGGTLKVTLKKKDDKNMIIQIKDDGCGIPKDRLAMLGEPFYTTKEKGTGLGLMVSYKIIENHHGQIKVNSKIGKGTTFQITLPVKKEAME